MIEVFKNMVKEKKLKERKKIDFKYNLREYWSLLRNYKLVLFGLLFVIFLIEALHIVPRYLFKEIIDRGTLFVGGDVGLSEFSFILLVIAGIYIGSNVIQITCFWFRSLFLSKIETNMMTDLKNRYFNHIVGLDTSFHTTHKTGSLISRLGRGSNSVERISDVLTFNFIPLIF